MVSHAAWPRQWTPDSAEYALLPNSLLIPVTTTLPRDILAALPETYLTAQGGLDALGAGPSGGGRLLIRGGTGLAAFHSDTLKGSAEAGRVAAGHPRGRGRRLPASCLRRYAAS